MHISSTFVAQPQVTKLMQSGEGGLDHPVRQTRTAAVTNASPADLWAIVTLSQDLPICLTVLAAVGLQVGCS